MSALALGATALTGAGATAAHAADPAPACAISGGVRTCTYSYTGGPQTWRAPYGVPEVTVTAYGAAGSPGLSGVGSLPRTQGGPGGREVVVLSGLTPGQVVQVTVGGTGKPDPGGSAYGYGGYNGGGDGWSGGGGASDLRTADPATGTFGLGRRIVVAGGGGGGGSYTPDFNNYNPPYPAAPSDGAGGGGATGSNAYAAPLPDVTYGGTQSAGGSNSTGGRSAGNVSYGGTPYKGGCQDAAAGAGGSCLAFFSDGRLVAGGGGGGGWYGGGFGSDQRTYRVGGAGGSNHAESREGVGVAEVSSSAGGTFTPPPGLNGNGLVQFSWPVPGLLGVGGGWSAAPGQSVQFTSGGRGYTLAMQNDGNLVQYEQATNAAVWATGTWGHPGATARFTTEGRLEVTDPSGGPALWRSATAGGPSGALAAGADGALVITDGQGQLRWTTSLTGRFSSLVLAPDQAVSVTHHQLVMQGDGNLVWYDRAAVPLWASNTWNNPGYSARFTDGALRVLSTTGTVVQAWPGTTAPDRQLGLQGDGNLVVYAADGQPVWASGTLG